MDNRTLNGRRKGKTVAHGCSECGVREIALCASLTDAELNALNSIGRHRRFARGEAVVWAGEDDGICANVVSGILKISAMTVDGREQIVGLLYPGDFVGHPYSTSADHSIVAVTEAELCMFPQQQFERLLEEHVAMERLLLKRTLAELERSRDWMLFLGRLTAREKIASFLADVARRAAPGVDCAVERPEIIELPISRGELADLLGLTLETVSRQFAKLKEARLIETPSARRIVILDRAALEADALQLRPERAMT